MQTEEDIIISVLTIFDKILKTVEVLLIIIMLIMLHTGGSKPAAEKSQLSVMWSHCSQCKVKLFLMSQLQIGITFDTINTG